MIKRLKILCIIIVLILITSTVVGCLFKKEPEEKYGPYIKDINRNYQNETEKELISIAENITPPDGQWWVYHGSDKIADCVNIEAIEYFSDVIDDLRNRENNYNERDIKKANFTYYVNIRYITNNGEYNTSETNLIEVNLTMHYSYWVSAKGAKWVDHYRCVIFNYNKEVVEVINDDVWPKVLVA